MDQEKNALVDFLSAIDTGIRDIEYDDSDKEIKFVTYHKGKDGELHPLLLKFIIDLFYENESKAQLIYTTHDTTLLDKKFFRRDQILFVQKDEFGYSELSALSDFKVRSDASFEKVGYKPSKYDPGTMVHKLVESLKVYLE